MRSMIARPLEEVTHGLDPGLSLGPVPRVCVGFFRKLGAIKPRVPMIVTGAMTSWPAMTSWTPEALKACIGDRRVDVLVHSDGASNRSDCISVSFREFIDAVVPEVPLHPWHLAVGSIYAQRPPRFVPRRVARYLHRFPTAVFPELERDVNVEPLIELRTILEMNIWIAYNGAITKLHFDQTDNLLAVVSGRKKLLLFDPFQAKYLYREHYLNSNFNFSKIDPENVDFNSLGVGWTATSISTEFGTTPSKKRKSNVFNEGKEPGRRLGHSDG